MIGSKEQVKIEIRAAYIFLRDKNHTIPSETLQFMLDASLEKLDKITSKSETKSCDFVYHNRSIIKWGICDYCNTKTLVK